VRGSGAEGHNTELTSLVPKQFLLLYGEGEANLKLNQGKFSAPGGSEHSFRIMPGNIPVSHSI
jgi:hypothetical protein